MRLELFSIPIAILALIPAVNAADPANAALTNRGAEVSVSSKNGINDRWNKPADMMKTEDPGGPILNDLSSAKIAVTLPLPMHIVSIGLKQGDYNGTFSKVKGIVIKSPGVSPQKFTLQNKPGFLQTFKYHTQSSKVEIDVASVYSPISGKDGIGALDQVQVLVDDDINTIFSPPTLRPAGKPLIMMTPNRDRSETVKVIGKPRMAFEHPFTIWDKQDITEIKAQIATYPKAKDAYRRLLAGSDELCAQHIRVPDKPDDDGPGAEEIVRQHTAAACGIANLGISYALSGDEKYAVEARRLLLELSTRYEGWPLHDSPNFHFDQSKWSWQRLGDALWLIPSAWGYDLIYNSPSMTAADRTAIQDHFIMPCVCNIMSSPSYIEAPTNWSVIGAAAVMVGSRACGDREYFEKSYLGLSREPGKKDGGVLYHLDNGIDDDGLWAEGSASYQNMAMRGLLVIAETLWHNGIDIYSYRNGRLKNVFDSLIWYAYPGAKSSPSIHDGGGEGLFGRDTHLYQYAMRRYGDKMYNALLGGVTPSLESVYNLFLPAFDFRPVDATDLPSVPSTLFTGAGFAIARTGDGDDSKYLVLDYGPDRSHGHPDKLNICLYGLGQELFADPGSTWYSTGSYKNYYSQTIAHNTVLADGNSQIMTGGALEDFSTLGGMSLIRATCGTAIPGTQLDRTVFLVGNRLYDIYHASSRIPHSFELPYHSHGDMQQTIATAAWKDAPAGKPGYSYLEAPKNASMDGDWRCSWKLPTGSMTMRYAGETGTQLVFAGSPMQSEELATAIVRRKASDTVFAGVCELVPNGQSEKLLKIRKIALPANAGYALRSDLADGSYEMLMVSYAPGIHTFGTWQTDARTAFVRVQNNRLSAFTLSGGTRLMGASISVTSSAPALLAYETVTPGLAQIANQAGPAADVRIQGIAAADSLYEVDRSGKRLTQVDVDSKKRAGVLDLQLAAGKSYELAMGMQPSVEQIALSSRKEKLISQQQRLERLQAETAAHIAAQTAAAKAAAVPEYYFALAQAESPAAQGGGAVTAAKKVGAYGSAIRGWNDRGQWLDYDFNIPRDGWYKVVLKYAREGEPTERSLTIDGLPTVAGPSFEMPGTGGWSTDSDQWSYYTLHWPGSDAPALAHLTPGKHRLHLVNPVGDSGVNLDYILITAPFMTIDKNAVENPDKPQ